VTNYESARKDDRIKVQPGDLVGMFSVPPTDPRGVLQHSVIAESSTVWFGANNTGAFGVPGGFRRVVLPPAQASGSGWQGSGNDWRTLGSGEVVKVVYRRFA